MSYNKFDTLIKALGKVKACRDGEITYTELRTEFSCDEIRAAAEVLDRLLAEAEQVGADL